MHYSYNLKLFQKGFIDYLISWPLKLIQGFRKVDPDKLELPVNGFLGHLPIFIIHSKVPVSPVLKSFVVGQK